MQYTFLLILFGLQVNIHVIVLCVCSFVGNSADVSSTVSKLDNCGN